MAVGTCAFPWVFGIPSSPELANPSGCGGGVFRAGRKIVECVRAGAQGARHSVAWAGLGRGICSVDNPTRDSEDGVQAAPSEVSHAEAGTISGRDSAAASRPGDLILGDLKPDKHRFGECSTWNILRDVC